MSPNRTTAALFTAAATIATAETTLSALYLPYRIVPLVAGTCAGLLSISAAREWTALRRNAMTAPHPGETR
jgi:hypothetical protein